MTHIYCGEIQMRKIKMIAKWAPVVLLALPLIGAGSGKLAGIPEFHTSFSAMGLPQWFGYFIGVVEILAGIGLLIPRLSALAATGIIPIMLGAVFFHVAYGVPSAVPAVVFTLLAVYAIYSHKNQAIWYPGNSTI